MKKILITFGFFVFLFAGSVQAGRGGDQGYGVIIGNPTGISAKMWLDNNWAVDGAVGVARSEFDVHATILHHHFGWVNRIANKWGWFKSMTSNGDLPFYWGVGPRILFEDKEEIGIRFPVGLNYLSHHSNFGVFVEFAPVWRFTPSNGFNGDFGLGVRYYFRSIKPQTEKKQ